MNKPKMPRKYWQKLADHNPVGIHCEPEDVQSWFDIIWPIYSTKPYTAHKRAIANWWRRVRSDEIQQAKDRRANIDSEAEVARLEAVAEDIESEDRGNVVPLDYFRRLEEG